MIKEKGVLLARKLMEIQLMMIRWNAKNVNHLFDINGKKPDTITRTQMEILTVIRTLEKATISQLASIMFTSKSSLSITVTRLVKDGYIERFKENCDGRITYLSVTEKAVKIMDKLMYEMTDRFSNYYKSLDKKNRDSLEQGIDCFYNILKSQGEAK